MSLKDTFSKAAQTGATVFSAVFTTVVYYANSTTVYDPSTGATSAIASSESVSMLLSKYKNMEIDGEQVHPTDRKGWIPQANINATPKVNHELQVVESGASVVYEIIDVQEDPANAGWTLQLRKP